MEKEFSLEAILTSTTGISCVNNFEEFFQLAWFVFDNDGINTMGLCAVRDSLREHLLSLYPQLAEVQYNPQFETSFESWLAEQKRTYGETLRVCQIGQTLSTAGRQM